MSELSPEKKEAMMRRISEHLDELAADTEPPPEEHPGEIQAERWARWRREHPGEKINPVIRIWKQ